MLHFLKQNSRSFVYTTCVLILVSGSLQSTLQDHDLFYSTTQILAKPPEFIPPPEKLLTWLQSPLLTPMNVCRNMYGHYFLGKASSDILNQYFVTSDNASSRLWTEVINPIAFPPTVGTTEESFHSLWDSLVIKPIKTSCPDGVFNRNTSDHTSTHRYRPEFSFLVHGACLVRGEEKGDNNNEDPGSELVTKLTWTYGKCPYIFGYYAIRARVTYCYMFSEGEEIRRRDLTTVNLENLEGRLQAFNIGRNIGRLLPLLRKTLPDYFQNEFVTLPRSCGKVVELMQHVVVKHYCQVEPVLNMKLYYDIMTDNRVPYTDQLVHINTEKGKTPSMILSPKGMCHEPRSLELPIIALYCVLSALKVPTYCHLLSVILTYCAFYSPFTA